MKKKYRDEPTKITHHDLGKRLATIQDIQHDIEQLWSHFGLEVGKTKQDIERVLAKRLPATRREQFINVILEGRYGDQDTVRVIFEHAPTVEMVILFGWVVSFGDEEPWVKLTLEKYTTRVTNKVNNWVSTQADTAWTAIQKQEIRLKKLENTLLNIDCIYIVDAHTRQEVVLVQGVHNVNTYISTLQTEKKHREDHTCTKKNGVS